MEHRNRAGDKELRGTRNFSGDSAGRPERREMNLPSLESGADKWERRGPLPPLEVNDRRTRSGNTPRSGSGNYNTASRSPSRETPADTGVWRSSKPGAPLSRSESTVTFSVLLTARPDAPPTVSPAQTGSPVVQRRKLNLLPRSEHAPETPAPTDEHRSKSNPFGAARPVDTDSVIKKVEEKLAKEREQKEEQAIKGLSTTSLPSSPTAPRHDKARSNPKQLLRRSSANPPTSSIQNQPDSDTTKILPEQTTADVSDKAWRKVESEATSSEPAPNDDEAGWETVPARGKRVNGVGPRH